MSTSASTVFYLLVGSFELIYFLSSSSLSVSGRGHITATWLICVMHVTSQHLLISCSPELHSDTEYLSHMNHGPRSARHDSTDSSVGEGTGRTAPGRSSSPFAAQSPHCSVPAAGALAWRPFRAIRLLLFSYPIQFDPIQSNPSLWVSPLSSLLPLLSSLLRWLFFTS